MYSKEFNCITKLITVCNNRGLNAIGQEILDNIAPKYLNKTDIKKMYILPASTLLTNIPKSEKFAFKVTFFNETKFDKSCATCYKTVEKGSSAFVKGKNIYHILCGLEVLGEDAKDNIYYNRWAMTNKKD